MAKVKFRTNIGGPLAVEMGLKTEQCVRGAEAEVSDRHAQHLAAKQWAEIVAVPPVAETIRAVPPVPQQPFTTPTSSKRK
jgi:hypothetical protein